MIRHFFTLIWNRKGQNVLLILEIFLAFLILFAVLGLVIFGLDRYRIPLGFETEDVLIAQINVPEDTDSLTIAATRARVKDALRSLPAVTGVSFSSGIAPFSGSNSVSSTAEMGFELRSALCMVDEDYSQTMGIRLSAGRWYHESDLAGKYTPIVVNQSWVDRYFPDSNMVDQVIRFNGEKKIVGIAAHYKYNSEFDDEEPITFYRLSDFHFDYFTMMIRLQPGTPADIEETLDKTIRNTARDWDFVIESLHQNRLRSSRRIWVTMVALLSICTFLVVNIAMGLFGVLMYNINRRRPEIGLRMALGATPGDIIRQFMAELLLLTGLGIVAGLVIAVQVPLLRPFEVPGWIYLAAGLGAITIICILVVLCTLYPSLQASRIHPATALHEE